MRSDLSDRVRDAGVDPAEIEKFERLAAEWWDPNGAQAPLHAMQPVRLDYIRRQISAELGLDPRRRRVFEGCRIVDIGCGGGLATEPMARLGATALGLDLSPGAIEAARSHAASVGVEVEYRCASAGEVAAELDEENRFDAALALEVVEHAADPTIVLSEAAALLKPGGVLIATTLNRTAKSFVAAIAIGEYAMRWLEPGTHEWSRFVSPDALAEAMRAVGLQPVDRIGFVYEPIARRWSSSEDDLSINYAMTAVKADLARQSSDG